MQTEIVDFVTVNTKVNLCGLIVRPIAIHLFESSAEEWAHLI